MDDRLTRRRLLAGGAAATLGALAGCSAMTPFVGKYESTERTLDVGDATHVAIDLPHGDVTVRGADRSDVHMVLTRSASSVQAELPDVEVSTDRTDGALTLSGSGDVDHDCGCAEFDVELAVPRSLPVASVSVETGDAELMDVRGDPTVDLPTGDFHAHDVDGDLEVTVGTGDVDVSRTAGSVAVQCDTGDVEIRRAAGHVSVDAGTGDIEVRDPGTTGDVVADVGDVEVDVPAIDGETRIRADTGDVDAAVASDVDANLEGRAGVGDLTVEGLDLADTERTEGTTGVELTGLLGDGGPRLLVAADVGDVTLGPLP